MGTFRLTRLRGIVLTDTAAITAPATAEPFETITVTASVSGSSTDYQFSQLSGPNGVFLAGTGPTRQFKMPAVENTTVTITLRVAGANPQTMGANALITLYPINEYTLLDGVWTPIEFYEL